MTRIVLSAIMDRSAVDVHRDELRGALSRGESIEIGCEGVEQIGLAGLQLLASTLRTGRESGVDVVLAGAADSLIASTALAGMSSILFPAPGASS